MQLIFDLETIPSQKPGALEEARATLKPPAAMKLAATIEKWWREESDAAALEAYRRQALDALHGEIVSIACVTGDGRQWARCRTQDETEADLLVSFGQQVTAWIDEDAAGAVDGYNFAQDPYLVAHNASFDVGFVWRRCIVNGVRLPFKVPGPLARAGQHYGCAMLLWAGFGGRVSLDGLCRALGITSPKDGGIDGAGVFDAWQAGEYDRIREYNLRDAVATAELWHRLNGGALAWAA